jgi:hypothetical protein
MILGSNAERMDFRQKSNQILKRPPHAIDRPSHGRVKLALGGVPAELSSAGRSSRPSTRTCIRKMLRNLALASGQRSASPELEAA